MAHSLISTGLLEIISNRQAGNAKRPETPPFPDVQGDFHGLKAGSAVGHRERLVVELSQPQMRR
jgi:hypothetical protein